MAPSRGSDFGNRMFFVYDREAVKKESDPPENAILYFYPTSVKVDDQVSICGQLIGMVHFMRSFLGTKPTLYKLREEKVATQHSGRYSFALGGSLDEPDSFLIRQLETLFNVFSFYHGSVERVAKLSKNRETFLAQMVIMWDCYLPFIRHYGDNLPQVFHPLPFLELPKKTFAACFLKATHILQACQRRQHVIGGCILYKNRILCTELEPTLTSRLLLLKPNQSHLPARPIKTEFNLPFGVRILNVFVTLSEYFNLYDALAQSPYLQSYQSNSCGSGTALGSSQTPDESNGREQKSTCACTRLGELAEYSGHGGSDTKTDIDTQSVAVAISEGTYNSKQTSELVGKNMDGQTVKKAELPAVSMDIKKQPDLVAGRNYLWDTSQTSPSPISSENVYVKKSLLENRPMARENVNASSSLAPGTLKSGNAVESAQTFAIVPSETLHQEAEEAKDCESGCCLRSGDAETCNGRGDVNQINSEITKPIKREHTDGDEKGEEMEDARATKYSIYHSSKDKDIFDNCARKNENRNLNIETFLSMDAVDVSQLRVVDASIDLRESLKSDSDTNQAYKLTSEILDDVIFHVAQKESETISQQNFENYRTFLRQVCVSVVNDLIETVCSSESLCYEESQGTKDLMAPKTEDVFQTESSKATSLAPQNYSGEVRTINGVLVDSRTQEGEAFHESMDSDLAEYTSPQNISRKGAINRSSESSLEGEEGRIFCGGEGSIEFPASKSNCASKKISTFKSAKRKGTAKEKAYTEEKNAAKKETKYTFNEKNDFSNCTDLNTTWVPNKFCSNPDQSEKNPSPMSCDPASNSESLRMRGSTDDEKSTYDSPNDKDTMQYEPTGEDFNKVEDMAHINLYVQAHSDVVLILLAEVGLQQENTIKALWETSLSGLGELECQVNEALATCTKHSQNHDYSFLVYNSIESTMKGNLDEPVLQVDNMFCDMAKHMHEQFINSDSLKDVTLRSHTSAVHGKRTLGRETYFQQKGFFRAAQGVPSQRDPAFSLEKRAGKVLNKEHGVNVF